MSKEKDALQVYEHLANNDVRLSRRDRIEWAYLLYKSCAYEKAKGVYSSLTSDVTWRVDALYGLSLCLMMTQQYDSAMQTATALQLEDPDHQGARKILAELEVRGCDNNEKDV